MKKGNILLIFFIILLIFSVAMFVLATPGITGHATSDTTVSEVTITNYLSISMSENLGTGIAFGSVSTLPATDVNATNNYDGGSSASTLSIEVSEDSNTAVDFCIKADGDLTTSGADTLGLGNETYANATSSDVDTPALANEVALTESYVKAGDSVAAGSTNYYRFWLDIPAAQTPGTYNNTVYFEGVNTGGACS